MSKKDFTLTGKILITLLMMGDTFLVTPRELRRRAYKGNLLGDNRDVVSIVYYLVQKGYLKYVNKDNEKFIKLTKKGQLKALLDKARMPDRDSKWDGKWRMIIFDIPEESKDKRHFFRTLLKQNGFIRLQHSVYINPYPLNREAVQYLQESGLINYIRIIKIEEIDNDKDIKKKFGLV